MANDIAFVHLLGPARADGSPLWAQADSEPLAQQLAPECSPVAVFGAGHPALHLLLLISIGSNLAGLALLGVMLPAASLRLFWLALPVLAVGTVWLTHGRHALAESERAHRRAARLWPYILAGLVSWLGVVAAGLPGALGLLPVLPAIPHSHRAFGVFAEAEALYWAIRPVRGVEEMARVLQRHGVPVFVSVSPAAPIG